MARRVPASEKIFFGLRTLVKKNAFRRKFALLNYFPRQNQNFSVFSGAKGAILCL